MTNKELNKLYYLNRDIERLSTRIEELESAAEGTTTKITGMPGGGITSDKVAQYALELTEMRLKLEAAKIAAVRELMRLTDYIEGIEDPLMRQIMQYRHVNGMNWIQVSCLIGGGNSPESVRQAHKRYLGKDD